MVRAGPGRSRALRGAGRGPSSVPGGREAMNVLEQLVLAWHGLVFALRQLGRGTMWLPWLLLGVIQLSFLALVWWFAHPFVSWLMAPLLVRLAGESVLHYPRLFDAMPSLYARADVLLSAIFGTLAAGASTAL